jgi:hypothetical protein
MKKMPFLIILTAIILLSGCSNNVETKQKISNKEASVEVYANSKEIIDELTLKAMKIDSFANDYIVNGQVVKRMAFQFSKDGNPFYRFRSEYQMNGKKIINFINLDGQYDYEFYPDDNIAYRKEKSADSWNEQNYDQAKKWHFNYDDMNVVGEDVVNGKECYLLKSSDGSKMCIWKEYGVQLDLRFNQNGVNGVMYYDNFEFNLDDNLFIIPESVKIVDKQ